MFFGMTKQIGQAPFSILALSFFVLISSSTVARERTGGRGPRVGRFRIFVRSFSHSRALLVVSIKDCRRLSQPGQSARFGSLNVIVVTPLFREGLAHYYVY